MRLGSQVGRAKAKDVDRIDSAVSQDDVVTETRRILSVFEYLGRHRADHWRIIHKTGRFQWRTTGKEPLVASPVVGKLVST